MTLNNISHLKTSKTKNNKILSDSKLNLATCGTQSLSHRWRIARVNPGEQTFCPFEEFFDILYHCAPSRGFDFQTLKFVEVFGCKT